MKNQLLDEVVKNKGNAVVEATLLLPFFIFGMLALYHIGRAKLAEQVVYEAAVETAEYLAEEAYLEIYNPITPFVKLKEYVDDSDLIERYIQNGIDGIFISGYTEPDENNQITIKVSFTMVVSVPLLPKLTSSRIFEITQQIYVGDKKYAKDGNENEDQYVFVTDNRDVYHVSRECSHLLLSVHSANPDKIRNQYTPCEFCGNEWRGGVVFVTDDGKRFHCSVNCSGLKRTVYRVKKSSIGGLPGCTRCTN